MRAMSFSSAFVPKGFADMLAVHLEDDTGICFGQSVQKLNLHVDFGTAFRMVAAQTIAQGKITYADISAEYPLANTPPKQRWATKP